MYSNELYQKYMDAMNQRVALENEIENYVEEWKKGDSVLTDEILEQIIDDNYKRVDDLKKIEEAIHQDYIKMSNLEEQKKSADIGIRQNFGEAPTNMKIVDGVLSPNASESHLVAEKKSDDELQADREEMLNKLNEKVKSGEISLERASQLSAQINASYGFYDKEKEMQEKHM